MTADDCILLAKAHGAQHISASWRGPQSLPAKPGSVTMTEAQLLDFAQAVIAAHEAQRQTGQEIPTRMTIAPREHSWHGQQLRNDTLGALVRQAGQTLYVAAYKCYGCAHTGINDQSATQSACLSCDWIGDSPLQDHCPGCGQDDTVTSACPTCGARYELEVDADLLVKAQ